MKIIKKTINGTFLIASVVLSTISLYGVVLTLIHSMMHYELDPFHMESVLFFVKQFESLIPVFTGTLAIVGAYLVIRQITVAQTANDFAEKNEWIKMAYDKLIAMDAQDNIINEHFYQYIDEMYDFIKPYNKKFSNRETLSEFFDEFFTTEELQEFEVQAQSINKNSWFHFEKVATSILKRKRKYTKFADDLEELYEAKLNPKAPPAPPQPAAK